jgi:hypothetical protein
MASVVSVPTAFIGDTLLEGADRVEKSHNVDLNPIY